jgi:ketosteroid isomerase-like protein
MDDEHRRTKNRKAFESVIDTVSAGRFEDLGSFMTADLEFELPYGPDFIPNPIRGLEAWNEMQLMTFKLFRVFRLHLDRVHEGVDPDELIFEYHSEAVVERNGNAYENTYIGVVRFRDGKIAHWREYHNPEATRVL